MAYHKVSEELQAAWDALSSKWNAEVKSKYFNQIFLPLLLESDQMYQRNENLEEYAKNCVNSLAYIKGDN